MNKPTQLKCKINNILTSWNPLSVPEALAFYEYESYIDPIIAIGTDVQGLRDYLRHTLTVTMGLDYKDEDEHHKADLDSIITTIIKVLAQ